jgi:hypothetical protein
MVAKYAIGSSNIIITWRHMFFFPG